MKIPDHSYTSTNVRYTVYYESGPGEFEPVQHAPYNPASKEEALRRAVAIADNGDGPRVVVHRHLERREVEDSVVWDSAKAWMVEGDE